MLRLWPIVVITVCVTWYFTSGANLFAFPVHFADFVALVASQAALLSSAFAFIAAVALGVLAWEVEKRRRDRERQALAVQSLDACVKSKTREHLATLRDVRRTLLASGELHRPRWFNFVDEFVGSRVAPALNVDELALFRDERDRIVYQVDALVEADAETSTAGSEFSPLMTPEEFESYCARTLQSAGWNARVNSGERAPGVDIIAAKGGRRITLHCIVDGRQVGSATLEAAEAGRDAEDADFAVVVTGLKLATPVELPMAAMKVVLIHHRYLSELEATLDRGQSAGVGPTPVPAEARPARSEEREGAARPHLEPADAVRAGAATRAARALASAARRIFRNQSKSSIYASPERAPWRNTQSPDFSAPIEDYPELDPKEAPPSIPNRPSQS